MRKRSVPVLVAVAALFAGCGSGGGEAATTDDTDAAATGDAATTSTSEVAPSTTETSDPDRFGPADLGVACVDEEVVAEATGVAVVDTSIDSGLHAGTGGPNLGWAGCTYDGEDGSEVTVSLLLGEDGEPSPEPFAQFAGVAGGPAESVDLGTAAFFDPAGALVVRTDAETFVFEVDGASLEPADRDLMVEVARGVLGHEEPALLPRCQAMRSLVPADWGEAGDVLAGGGGEGDVEFESCRVSLSAVAGADLTLKIAQGTDWYDQRAEGEPGDGPPVPVPGVGDEAYAFRGRLFVLAGDRAFVLSGEDAEDAMVEPTDLVDLAEAVIAAS